MSKIVETLKHILSNESIGNTWKVIKSIAGTVFLITTFLTSSASPILLSSKVQVWLGAIAVFCAIIVGRAQVDTSGTERKVKIT